MKSLSCYLNETLLNEMSSKMMGMVSSIRKYFPNYVDVEYSEEEKGVMISIPKNKISSYPKNYISGDLVFGIWADGLEFDVVEFFKGGKEYFDVDYLGELSRIKSYLKN